MVMNHLIIAMITLTLGFQTAHALPCDDESKDSDRIMSIVEEMQVIADKSESSPEHFCRGGRIEVSEFFKNSIDELNSYGDCPTIGPSAMRFVDMLKKQKFDLDYYFADVCK